MALLDQAQALSGQPSPLSPSAQRLATGYLLEIAEELRARAGSWAVDGC